MMYYLIKKKGFNASIDTLINLNDDYVKDLIFSKSEISDFIYQKKLETIIKRSNKNNQLSKFIFNIINCKIFFRFKHMIIVNFNKFGNANKNKNFIKNRQRLEKKFKSFSFIYSAKNIFILILYKKFDEYNFYEDDRFIVYINGLVENKKF